MEVLKKEVRSVLIAAKEGLTPAQLEQEYLAMVGKPLPLCDLGFTSTLELVADMPDAVRICPHNKGTFILRAIADETTKGIARLVARQRSVRARRSAALKAGAAFPSRNPQSPPQSSRDSILPAVVKAEVQDLPSSSPALLSDFAPAVEMPPVEPSCETDSFHLAVEEKSEPVATQAVGLGDGLKQEHEQGPFVAPLLMLEGRKQEERQQPQALEQPPLERLILTPEIPPDAVQEGSLCGLPPLGRRWMVGLFVGFVVSPSQFYVHARSGEARDELLDMMIELRHCYSDKRLCDRYVLPESSVRSGQLCCLMAASWWYRVVIHRVISHQEVEVFYTDYGNLEIVQKSWLRFLKQRYLELPAQAIPCSLARVQPVEGKWSSAATLLFKELCGSSMLVGIVDEYISGILHLFLCDTSTRQDVYFHHILRDRGHADICKENLPSQEFMELNPLALYVQPSGEQRDAELVEPELGLQQESLGADSETRSSKVDEEGACEQQQHLSAEEEIQGDVQPLLDEESLPRTHQDPELAQEDTKGTSTELMAVLQTPHSPGEPSIPAVLCKFVEDFYPSCIHIKQPAARRQDGSGQTGRFSSGLGRGAAVHPSVVLTAIPFMLDNHRDEDTVRSRDRPAVGPGGASGVPGPGPSRRLYVPPAALSVLLASARLAASSGSFQWLRSLRREL